MRGRTALVAAVLVGLAGCTSTPGAQAPAGQPGDVTTATTTTKPPEPFSLKLTPADKSEDVEPGVPVTVAVGGGLLTEVVLKNEAGKVVKGALSGDARTW